MFIRHDYTPWSDPLETYDGRTQQWRCCKDCNKAQFRTLRWHGQTALPAILGAIRRIPGKLDVLIDSGLATKQIEKI